MYKPLVPKDHDTTSSAGSLDATSFTGSPDAIPPSYLPEHMPLKLPSMLPVSLHKSCKFELVQIELCFCLAQAEDNLSELRHLL